MLKWTSESEYFLSFEKNFADTIYIIIDSIARTWIGNAIEIVFAILVTVT